MSQDCTSGGGWGGGGSSVWEGESNVGEGKELVVLRLDAFKHVKCINFRCDCFFSVETVLKFDPRICFVF